MPKFTVLLNWECSRFVEVEAEGEAEARGYVMGIAPDLIKTFDPTDPDLKTLEIVNVDGAEEATDG